MPAISFSEIYITNSRLCCAFINSRLYTFRSTAYWRPRKPWTAATLAASTRPVSPTWRNSRRARKRISRAAWSHVASEALRSPTRKSSSRRWIRLSAAPSSRSPSPSTQVRPKWYCVQSARPATDLGPGASHASRRSASEQASRWIPANPSRSSPYPRLRCISSLPDLLLNPLRSTRRKLIFVFSFWSNLWGCDRLSKTCTFTAWQLESTRYVIRDAQKTRAYRRGVKSRGYTRNYLRSANALVFFFNLRAISRY